MSGRLGEVERKLRGADDDLSEIRKELRMALQQAQAISPGGGTCPVTFDFDVTVSGTGAPIFNCFILVKDPFGNPVANCGTDTSGFGTTGTILVAYPGGTYTATVSAGGYTTQTVNVAPSCGNTVTTNVSMVAAGITVGCCSGVTIPTSLTGLDLLTGTTMTMTYGATALPGGVAGWRGCAMVATAGGGGCPAGSSPYWYNLRASDCAFFRQFILVPVGATLCQDVTKTCANTPTFTDTIHSVATVACSPFLVTYTIGAGHTIEVHA